MIKSIWQLSNARPSVVFEYVLLGLKQNVRNFQHLEVV